MNSDDAKEERLTLQLLDAIEHRSDVSQRHLARHMGIALGLANSYLKRCAKKGLVKIREAPANRYFYYLTPKGFAEKARLTARFLSTSLAFYRRAAESCSEIYSQCTQLGWRRLVLCGVSDLAEIAVLRALESDIEVVGVFDPGAQIDTLFTRPVWREWNQCAPADAFVITDLANPSAMYQSILVEVDDQERVLVPRVLGGDGALRAAGTLTQR